MTEINIVRQNRIDDKNYRPYCMSCKGLVRMRIELDNFQLKCPICEKETSYPDDFIQRYKTKWNLK